MIRLVLFVLLVLASPWLRAADDDLLEPEKAFVLSAQLTSAKNLEVRFDIAKGYYLYKKKIKLRAEGIKIGTPKLPAGKVKDDEFFGRVEIYPADIRIQVPVSGAKTGKTFTLKAEFQGCAEIGVCYPPQHSTLRLQVPKKFKKEPPVKEAVEPKTSAINDSKSDNSTDSAPPQADNNVADSAPPPTQDPSLIAKLKAMAGGLPGNLGTQEFLPPEQAFQLDLVTTPAGELQAVYTIAPGYYLYRDKLKLEVQSPAGTKLDALKLPVAEAKDDPNFGRMYVYHNSFSATAKLTGLPPGSNSLVVAASYQGCSEQGICYPPIDKTQTIPITATGTVPAATTPADALPAPSTAPAVVDTSESGQINALLKGGSFWLVVGTFFVIGLGLSLTPCVFPMIPILSGIIVGHGQQVTRRKGFLLSLAYVLGMAVTYALAGVAAGMSGTLISNALQNPWSLSIGAGIFVALAFSMFGFYELQLPSFLQSRFTEASNRMKGGNFIGVFVMGILSALIVGPCVAAPLAGALLYIGQSGDVVLGGISLFVMALGMGVPLLLIGLSAGTLLPRAGAWMEAVKKFFGVLLLGVAIWLIAPLMAEVMAMFLWACLLIISGVYLRAVDPLANHASGWHRFWKGIGIITLIAGVAILLGALGGGRDLLQPLAVFKGGSANSSQESRHLTFQRVRSLAELEQAVAGANGKQVMLDFYADWCVSCKEMERFTFTDAKVNDRLKNVLLLQADVTANNADDKALLKRFSLFGPPGIIFFDTAGKEIAYRVVGYEPPEKFLQSLDQALK